MNDQKQDLNSLRERLKRARDAGEITIPSARDLLRVAFRHKYQILLVFAVIAVGGGWFVMSMPDQFESEARLYLRPERGDISIDPTSPGLVSSRQGQSMNAAENEIAILSSRLLHEQVVKEIGPEIILGFDEGETVETEFAKAPDPREAAHRFATRVLGKAATFSGEGDIVVVKYQNKSAHDAQTVVEKIVECYLERHLEVHRSSFNPEIFRKEADEILAKIRDKERELREYNEGNNVLSVQERRTSLLAQKERYTEQIAQNRVDVEMSRAKVESLRQSLGTRAEGSKIPPSQMENPEVVAYKQQLTQLQIEKTRLESVFSGGNQLDSINYQIEETKNKIASLPATVPRRAAAGSDGVGTDPYLLLANEQMHLEALEAAGTRLETYLQDTMAQLASLGDDSKMQALEQELAQLRMDYERANEAYNDVALNARLDEEKVSNVSVLNPANLPDEPVGPRRVRNLAAVLFLAAAAAIGLALVREFLDDTLKTRDEIERKLGLPVLAVVPAEEFRKCI